MSNSDHLTTRQVGDLFGHPEWRIRRISDKLVGIPRFGGKRAIPRSRLPEIAKLLSKEDRQQ